MKTGRLNLAKIYLKRLEEEIFLLLRRPWRRGGELIGGTAQRMGIPLYISVPWGALHLAISGKALNVLSSSFRMDQKWMP
eukprot:14127646-Ditylum_brightwellii.AAC.1